MRDIGEVVTELDEHLLVEMLFLVTETSYNIVDIPFLIDRANSNFTVDFAHLQKVANARALNRLVKTPHLSVVLDSFENADNLKTQLAYANSLPHRSWAQPPRGSRVVAATHRASYSAYGQWLIHGTFLQPTVVLESFSSSSRTRRVMRTQTSKSSETPTARDPDSVALPETVVPFIESVSRADVLASTPRVPDRKVGYVSSLASRGHLKLIEKSVDADGHAWGFTLLWNCYQMSDVGEFMPYKFCETSFRYVADNVQRLTCTCPVFCNLARRTGTDGE